MCCRPLVAVLDPCDIVPSDYVLSQLESLGQILSYCLIEGGQAQGGVSATPSPLGKLIIEGGQAQGGVSATPSTLGKPIIERGQTQGGVSATPSSLGKPIIEEGQAQRGRVRHALSTR